MQIISTQTKTPYSIYIEEKLLTRVPEFIEAGRKIAIVTDDTVNALYGEALSASLEAAGRTVCKFVFPHGEHSKSLQTLSQVYTFLSQNAITRTDLIVALGGGVVGDLAGYAAASWLRGIDFVQIPTTLLAMVDSSVGGKTAVDLPEGKNLVGAFWQPSMVLCDPTTLETLPQETFADGMAEAIKTGAILDEALFALLEQDISGRMTEIIARCIDHKRRVVEEDERDTGIRQWLNFGHTLGHAIERESGYTIAHGRAVAIGMAMITRACERQGLLAAGTAERIAACCARYGLPDTTPYPLDVLCAHCMGDKKRAGATLNLVILERLGKAVLYPIAAQSLQAFLEGAGA